MLNIIQPHNVKLIQRLNKTTTTAAAATIKWSKRKIHWSCSNARVAQIITYSCFLYPVNPEYIFIILLNIINRQLQCEHIVHSVDTVRIWFNYKTRDHGITIVADTFKINLNMYCYLYSGHSMHAFLLCNTLFCVLCMCVYFVFLFVFIFIYIFIFAFCFFFSVCFYHFQLF